MDKVANGLEDLQMGVFVDLRIYGSGLKSSVRSNRTEVGDLQFKEGRWRCVMVGPLWRFQDSGGWLFVFGNYSTTVLLNLSVQHLHWESGTEAWKGKIDTISSGMKEALTNLNSPIEYHSYELLDISYSILDNPTKGNLDQIGILIFGALWFSCFAWMAMINRLKMADLLAK
ncbi:hypothetical protein M5K25_026513 [Dendrobium thyrsiflorum]|uniref:Uncharacterized protein n=1 Tax=Dendrobium thyrsiflorum TaxID=117978 RepID=A0ABD0TXR1_DENTH